MFTWEFDLLLLNWLQNLFTIAFFFSKTDMKNVLGPQQYSTRCAPDPDSSVPPSPPPTLSPCPSPCASNLQEELYRNTLSIDPPAVQLKDMESVINYHSNYIQQIKNVNTKLQLLLKNHFSSKNIDRFSSWTWYRSLFAISEYRMGNTSYAYLELKRVFLIQFSNTTAEVHTDINGVK